VHYKPNHLLSFFKSETLPATERLYAELVTLPLHPGLNDADVTRVCACLGRALRSG
jgi:dTDP-4-amino-4,6-dideoxygalactose transaminase